MVVNRTNIAEHLVEYQLSMVGKSMQEALLTPEWYSDWTITYEQYEVLKKYAIPLIKKVFKCNKSRAEGIFGWWNLQFGLRISHFPMEEDDAEKL